MLAIESATWLGPAVVTRVDGRRVEATLPDGESVTARLAIAYRPVAGDELLVARYGADAYVLGVLEGTGGSLELEAAEVRIRAGRLEVTAERIVEKARDVYRWFAGLLHLRAGRMRTSVEDDYQLRAGTAVVKAREDVVVDGESIHLG